MNSSDEELPKKSSKYNSSSLKFDKSSLAKPTNSILKSTLRKNDSDEEKQDEPYRRQNSPISSSRSINSKPPTGRLPILNESSSSSKPTTSKKPLGKSLLEDSDEDEKTNYTSVVSSSSRKFASKKSDSDEEDKKLTSRSATTNSSNKKYSSMRSDKSDEEKLPKKYDRKKQVSDDEEEDSKYKKKITSKYDESDEEKLPVKKTSPYNLKFDKSKKSDDDDYDKDTLSSRLQKKTQLQSLKKPESPRAKVSKYENSDEDELKTNKKFNNNNNNTKTNINSEEEDEKLSSRLKKINDSPKPTIKSTSKYDFQEENKYGRKSPLVKKPLKSDDEDEKLSSRLKKVSESPKQASKMLNYDFSDDEKISKKTPKKPLNSDNEEESLSSRYKKLGDSSKLNTRNTTNYDLSDEDKFGRKTTSQTKKLLKSDDEPEFDLKTKSYKSFESTTKKFGQKNDSDDERDKKYNLVSKPQAKQASANKRLSDSDDEFKKLKKELTSEPKKEDWRASFRKDLTSLSINLDNLKASDKLRKSPESQLKKQDKEASKRFTFKSEDDDDDIQIDKKKPSVDRYQIKNSDMAEKSLNTRLNKPTEYDFDSKKKTSNYADDDFTRRYGELNKNREDSLMSRTAPQATNLSAYNSVSNLTKLSDNNNKTQAITRNNSANQLITDKNKNLKVKDAKNRSFLVGSISSKGLLGSQELDRVLVDRKASVFAVTWNMGCMKTFPERLEELILPDNIETMPDLFAIGAQEFDLNRKDWEIKLQELIGPSHVKLASHYYGALALNVFIRRDLIWFCSVIDSEEIPVRKVFTPVSTKGSVLISFQLFGTLICFICSHFVSDDENSEERIENYRSTTTSITLPKSIELKNRKPLDGTNDMTDNFDCVFWFGDFNSRSKRDREKVLRKVEDLKDRKSNDFEDLLNHDELQQNIRNNKSFRNFLEPRIRFKPTYKFDVQTDNYDTSEKCRIPSYCDRILYRTKQKNAVSCFVYDYVKELRESDHRAVYSLFEMNIKSGVDKVPLSFGEFDKDIYIAGYKKRQMYRALDIGFGSTLSTNNNAHFTDKTSSQSTKKSKCPIQ